MDYNLTCWNVNVLTDNVINCALGIMPETDRVYFASDSFEPAQYILTESPLTQTNLRQAVQNSMNSSTKLVPLKSANQPFPKIVTRFDAATEPVHFNSKRSSDPKEFFSIFVDLWIMGHAKCVSHGVGGFPRYAASLTGNYDTCRSKSWKFKEGTVSYCPDFRTRLGLNVTQRFVIPH